MKRCAVYAVSVALICAVTCSREHEGRKDMTSGQVTWNFDTIERIGENVVTVFGSPEVIVTPGGKAVEFDGEKDGLLVETYPLQGIGVFTLEVIFRPDADGLPEQRFFHLQEDGSENRILIETRLTEDNQWYLDTFMQSGETGQTLIDEQFIHPVGAWYNAVLIFDGREMRHYVNSVRELSAQIASYNPLQKGKTSIGVRINRVCWFKGAIRTARFTPWVLTPEEFFLP